MVVIMFGKAITDYVQFSIGLYGYIVSMDLADLNAKVVTGIQAAQGSSVSPVINEEKTIAEINELVNDITCPNLAYCISSDILYLFVKTSAYPYNATTKFVVYGKRYAKPLSSLDDSLDIKETEVELFINYALREGSLYQGKKADPVIEQNIRLLESQV
jgi:hypothetical protein